MDVSKVNYEQEMLDILKNFKEARKKKGNGSDPCDDAIDMPKQIQEIIKPGDSIEIYGNNLSAVINTKNYSVDEIQLIHQFIAFATQVLDSADDESDYINGLVDELIEEAVVKTENSNAQLKTKYPETYITPIDKVSDKLFAGDILDGFQSLAMEKRGSKKAITTLVSIDFDNLDDDVKIRGRKELTAYDRQIHDAILTSYLVGNNYITPNMIYKVITGNSNAKLHPKQLAAINESIDVCLRNRITIDASEEAKERGFDEFKYEGYLISADRITAKLNGTMIDCLKILRTPILYEYASKKGQIGRANIKLIDTPINKSEESLLLQSYIFRRIIRMKSKSRTTVNRIILFETIYNQIDLKDNNRVSLNKKKKKIRDNTFSMLDYWETEKFIKGYAVNNKGKSFYSITIDV